MGKRIKIKGTNDTDIAYALANLSGFGKGTYVGRTNNIWHKELSQECAVVFHKDTLNEAGGDLTEAMVCLGPDIIVSRVYKRPENEPVFEPSNWYSIDFNEKRIDLSLIEKIEGEIRLAHSER